ncbi:hypothetical protein PHJA_001177000 [Phtheirospermum japonicum]|uniref:Uncharacterized protein n=1 Tax=Phtheirospermum japonicum TaxID=374723 RepID=A0A830C7U8_9LAMI|nr:hypothetical protein PHJA_001177000 [Phtheirospermum japonicum]
MTKDMKLACCIYSSKLNYMCIRKEDKAEEFALCSTHHEATFRGNYSQESQREVH